MNDTQLSNPSEQTDGYLSYTEAAEKLNVDESTLGKWLNQHPNIKNQYVSKRHHAGRLRFVLSTSALVVIGSMKDSPKSNRFQKKVVTTEILQAKKESAEIALFATTPSTDPILANLQQLMLVRQQQLNQQGQINELKQEIAEVKQLALESPPVDFTTSQREFLNDRLRNYCIKTELSFPYVWNKIHNYMGKHSINDYKFEDYKVAIRYLKSMYGSVGLEWS